MKSVSTQPLLTVCLVSVFDWKHFRNGDQQQVKGAWALMSVLLIDPMHILKIKEGIKGIAKLFKTLHTPKGAPMTAWTSKAGGGCWLEHSHLQLPSQPRQTAQGFYFNAGQQCGSHFDWHVCLIRGQRDSLNKSKAQKNNQNHCRGQITRI